MCSSDLYFRRPLPESVPVRPCYLPEVEPEVRPELPVYRKYRPAQRYFRSCGIELAWRGPLTEERRAGRKYRPHLRYFRCCGTLGCCQVSNGQISWWGLNTPSPTFGGLALHTLSPPFMPSKLKVQIRKISQSLHPNPLILGGLKEKAPIYNSTEQFSISPSFI